MNKLKLTLAVIFTFGFSNNLLAVPEGAFTALWVQAKDVYKYIDHMKNNPETFEALGASDAGVCVTRAGNNYPGEMFVWSAFPNLEGALSMIETYDPFNPDPVYKRLRKAKYTSAFKPLKDNPILPQDTFERLWRIKLNDENAFTAKMVKLEKALQAAGHDVRLGVYAPVGGGVHETGMFHFRAIFNNGAEAGKALDGFYAGASFSTIWADAQEYVDGIVSETVELCQVIYTAK